MWEKMLVGMRPCRWTPSEALPAPLEGQALGQSQNMRSQRTFTPRKGYSGLCPSPNGLVPSAEGCLGRELGETLMYSTSFLLEERGVKTRVEK